MRIHILTLADVAKAAVWILWSSVSSHLGASDAACGVVLYLSSRAFATSDGDAERTYVARLARLGERGRVSGAALLVLLPSTPRRF